MYSRRCLGIIYPIHVQKFLKTFSRPLVNSWSAPAFLLLLLVLSFTSWSCSCSYSWFYLVPALGVYKQTMVVLCWLCFKVAAATLKGILKHIGTIHSCEPNFSITCGVHSCPRRYSNFFSFKKHLYRKHRAELELQEFTPIFSNGDDEVHFLNNETQAADTGADVFDVNPITSTTELKKQLHCFF